MLSFRKKQPQASAEIHLGSKPDGEAQRPSDKQWLSYEDVTGYAVYTLPTGIDFSRSKVTLRGLSRPEFTVSKEMHRTNIMEAL